jgi:heat shock protein HtpX
LEVTVSRNTVKTFVLLAALGGLFVLVGGLIASRAGALVGFALGLLVVGGSYWFSAGLAVRAARARRVTAAEDPRLAAIVTGLTPRAGLPMPELYVAPSDQPNAFATGRNPRHAAVCVTQGALDLLDDEELRGVLAHELSHVANRDILIASIAAAIAMALTVVARMAMWGTLLGGGRGRRGNPIGLLAMSLLALLAATVPRSQPKSWAQIPPPTWRCSRSMRMICQPGGQVTPVRCMWATPSSPSATRWRSRVGQP